MFNWKRLKWFVDIPQGIKIFEEDKAHGNQKRLSLDFPQNFSTGDLVDVEGRRARDGIFRRIFRSSRIR